MFQAVQTKILLGIAAAVAALVSTVAYQQHQNSLMHQDLLCIETQLQHDAATRNQLLLLNLAAQRTVAEENAAIRRELKKQAEGPHPDWSEALRTVRMP